MTVRLYTNNGSSTLNGAITDSDTTITLNDASSFPSPGASEIAYATIDDGTNIEIISYTGVSTNDLTGVTRAQEGTSAVAFSDGDTIEVRTTALSYTDVLAADETPALRGPLDVTDSNAYIFFSGSSTATKYCLADATGIPRLYGNSNYFYGFTSSSLLMQAGTSFNRLEVKNDSTRFRFYTNNSERFQIDDSGVNISNGTLIVNSNNVEAAGISFDSGTNVLDEYEEGTFTPTLVGQSTAGSPTYSVQAGSYTRVGNRIICHIRMDWSSLGGLSGNVEVHGLPFTSVNDSNKRAFFFSHFYSGLSLPNNGLCGYVNFNATTMLMLYMNTTATSNVTDTELTAAGSFYGSILYEA